jgi:microcystin-dependent protein
MADPYVGEIRMFGGSFAPAGWAFCDGQLMPISENDVLFTLIGTTYGGDGQQTFGLPDLRSRIPVHVGTGPDGIAYQLGEASGVEQVTLTTQQIPTHSHAFVASSNNASTANASGNVLAQTPTYTPYIVDAPAGSALHASSIGSTGGNQPHNNLAPYLCVSFIISLFGIFPHQ